MEHMNLDGTITHVAKPNEWVTFLKDHGLSEPAARSKTALRILAIFIEELQDDMPTARKMFEDVLDEYERCTEACRQVQRDTYEKKLEYERNEKSLKITEQRLNSFRDELIAYQSEINLLETPEARDRFKLAQWYRNVAAQGSPSAQAEYNKTLGAILCGPMPCGIETPAAGVFS